MGTRSFSSCISFSSFCQITSKSSPFSILDCENNRLPCTVIVNPVSGCQLLTLIQLSQTLVIYICSILPISILIYIFILSFLFFLEKAKRFIFNIFHFPHFNPSPLALDSTHSRTAYSLNMSSQNHICGMGSCIN